MHLRKPKSAKLHAELWRARARIVELESQARAGTEPPAAGHQTAQLTADVSRSRDLLRTIIDGLEDGLALIDADGTILAANIALAELHGSTPRALAGLPLALVSGPLAAMVEAARHTGLPQRGRERASLAGRTCLLDIRSLPLGEAVVVHVVDVTERVELEALAVQNERLAATGRLAAIVAHEVNSPLQSLHNLLFLAEHGDGGPHLFQQLRGEVDHIAEIIRRLQEFDAHSASGNTADGRLLIERVLLLTGSRLSRQRIDVSSDLPQHIPLAADANDITQVLLNLVLRAADAMPVGGRLELRARCLGGLARIEVVDSGATPDHGRPSEVDPFYPSDTGLSWLNLSMSRRIVARYGGRLSLTDTPGGGATALVELPLSGPPEPDLEYGHERATGTHVPNQLQ